jgi:hypothetical protein
MGILCLFGHKWNGCKCERCGTTKDENHHFVIDAKACLEKCSICGKIRNLDHKWNGCKCEKCGTTRNQSHKYNTNDICEICGTPKKLTDKEASQLVGEYKQYLSQLLEENGLTINAAILESIRHVIVIKALIKISFSENHNYEQFLNSIKTYNQDYSYYTLLSLGKSAYYCVLAGFSSKEILKKNINKEYSADEYKKLMEDIIKSWYEENKTIKTLSDRMNLFN